MLQAHEMFTSSKCYSFLFFVGNVHHLEDLGVDWRIILTLRLPD